MKESLHKRAIDALEGFVRRFEEGGASPTSTEAELLLEIHKCAAPKIVRLGDTVNGFPASRKRFEKMVSLLRQMHTADFKVLIWDNLVSLINMEGEEITVEEPVACSWNVGKCHNRVSHVIKRPEWEHARLICEEHAKDVQEDFLFPIEFVEPRRT